MGEYDSDQIALKWSLRTYRFGNHLGKQWTEPYRSNPRANHDTRAQHGAAVALLVPDAFASSTFQHGRRSGQNLSPLIVLAVGNAPFRRCLICPTRCLGGPGASIQASVAVRIVFQVILVLRFGFPERTSLSSFGHDLAGPKSRSVYVGDRRTSGPLLFLASVEDRRAIAGSLVVGLTI
jgi:hypothetical protein